MSNDKQEEKKQKTAITNGKLKKKSEIRKFADNFIEEDASNVGSYILKEILIPSAKKLIADTVDNAVKMFLYGDADRQSKRSSSRISYREYYDDRDRPSRDDRRNTRRSRLTPEYDDVVVDSAGEAELVLDKLEATISRYGFAKVADLYEFANIPTDNYTLNDYGWTSVRNAHYKRIRDGYLLIMPKAIPIDKI